MKRHTQTILYHTLPIAFWLLAGVGCALWVFFDPAFQSEGWIRLLAAKTDVVTIIGAGEQAFSSLECIRRTLPLRDRLERAFYQRLDKQRIIMKFADAKQIL